MPLKIYPKMLRGTVTVPSSKTHTFLNILLASFSKESTIINNPNYTDEIISLISNLKLLGVEFKIEDTKIMVSSPKIFKRFTNTIECKKYDTILMSLLLISKFFSDDTTFHGDIEIIKELNKEVLDNLPINYLKTSETVNILSIEKVNEINLMNIPHSYLVIGTILYGILSKQEMIIHINNSLINDPHLHILKDVLKNYNINFEISPESNILTIPYQEIKSPGSINIEGDWLLASHYLGLGISNERILINNIQLESLQPERVIIDYLAKKNGIISQGDNMIIIEKSFLSSTNYDLSICPNLSILIICSSTISSGISILTGFSKLTLKLQNSILKLIILLNKMNAEIEVKGDLIIINGVKTLEGGLIDNEIDSLSILGLLTLINFFIMPLEFNNLNKFENKYPYFIKSLKNMGAEITERI